jgi:urease accessory protein
MGTATRPRAEEVVVVGVAPAVRLLQFGDSMLPVGSFSFSNALEPAIQEGVVRDLATLRAFVRTTTHRAATTDGIALLETHRAARAGHTERIVGTDRAVFARKLNEEMRTQTVRMGKKLVEVGTTVVGSPRLAEWLELIEQGMAPGTYPVGLGLVCAELDLPEQESFAIHQYGAAMTVLSAALRLMKVDHLTTQAVLFEVNARVEGDYAEIAGAALTDMATFAPMTDILATIHVRSHIRMFMN